MRANMNTIAGPVGVCGTRMEIVVPETEAANAIHKEMVTRRITLYVNILAQVTGIISSAEVSTTPMAWTQIATDRIMEILNIMSSKRLLNPRILR